MKKTSKAATSISAFLMAGPVLAQPTGDPLAKDTLGTFGYIKGIIIKAARIHTHDDRYILPAAHADFGADVRPSSRRCPPCCCEHPLQGKMDKSGCAQLCL